MKGWLTQNLILAFVVKWGKVYSQNLIRTPKINILVSMVDATILTYVLVFLLVCFVFLVLMFSGGNFFWGIQVKIWKKQFFSVTSHNLHCKNKLKQILKAKWSIWRLWSIQGNRPFYRYGGHIELIRFKEYYGMPKGH